MLWVSAFGRRESFESTCLRAFVFRDRVFMRMPAVVRVGHMMRVAVKVAAVIRRVNVVIGARIGVSVAR